MWQPRGPGAGREPGPDGGAQHAETRPHLPVAKLGPRELPPSFGCPLNEWQLLARAICGASMEYVLEEPWLSSLELAGGLLAARPCIPTMLSVAGLILCIIIESLNH